MKCREALEKIRKAREEKVHKYRIFLEGSFFFDRESKAASKEKALEKFGKKSRLNLNEIKALCLENLIDDQRNLLILECPSNTDPSNLNQLLGNTSPAQLKRPSDHLNKWIDEKYATNHKCPNSADRTHQKQHIKRRIANAWPKITKTQYTNGKLVESLEDALPEDFNMNDIREQFIANFIGSTDNTSSKKTLRSFAKTIIRLVLGVCRPPNNSWIPTTAQLAYYFDYLERRCLDSWTERKYNRLIEVRLMYYVPLTIPKLQQIKFGDSSRMDGLYPYP